MDTTAHASRSNTPLNAANAANPVSAHFDELRREMDSFLVMFNGWIDERRRTLTDDKDIYMRTLLEERETVEALKRQYQQLMAKKQSVLSTIEQENIEYREAVKANQELHGQSIQLRSRQDQLTREYQTLQQAIEAETRTVNTRQGESDQRLNKNKRTLMLFEEILGIQIEPVSNECIKIIFTNVNPKNMQMPFSVTIDHSAADKYSVKECHPIQIPDLPSITSALNQTHDFCQFVCRLRRRFEELLSGSQ